MTPLNYSHWGMQWMTETNAIFFVDRARDWKGWLTKEAKCAAPERSEALQSPASARIAITLLSHFNFSYIGNGKCVCFIRIIASRSDYRIWVMYL
jgi:hypothetical protein